MKGQVLRRVKGRGWGEAMRCNESIPGLESPAYFPVLPFMIKDKNYLKFLKKMVLRLLRSSSYHCNRRGDPHV